MGAKHMCYADTARIALDVGGAPRSLTDGAADWHAARMASLDDAKRQFFFVSY
jgi:hypothetical protein